MTDPTPLSPAAQAVLDAYYCDKPLVGSKRVAAALRAAVERLGFQDDYGTRLINVDDLLAIADQLENHQ